MKKIFFLLFLSALALSCNDDDNDATTPVTDASLNGSWNMETYVAFMAGLPVLEDGDVTWTFNTNNTVTVANTVAESYPYMLNSGTYNFTINNGIISIDNSGSYDYSIEGSQLNMAHVDAPADGGPVMTFSKN